MFMDTFFATGCFSLTMYRTASSQFFGTSIPKKTLWAITETLRARYTGFCNSQMDLRQSRSTIRNAVSTTATGLNPEGAIVGMYTDTKGQTHGFLAIAVRGH